MKQNQIFQQHLNKIYIPQQKNEYQVISREENSIRNLKEQAQNYEEQKMKNIKTIKGEYSDFLSNQMKEKEYTQSIIMRENKVYHDDIQMKHQLQEEKTKLQEKEKIENQMAYRDVLHNQQRYRNEHPESSLRGVNNTVYPVNAQIKETNINKEIPNYLHLDPSNGLIAASQNIEPVGPVNANIGLF